MMKKILVLLFAICCLAVTAFSQTPTSTPASKPKPQAEHFTAVAMLSRAPLLSATGMAATRIAGAALVALAIGCWQARNGERGSPATGVVESMTFYNFAAAMVLVDAGIRLDLRSGLLWPAIVLHLCLGVWCVSILWFSRRRLSKSEMTL